MLHNLKYHNLFFMLNHISCHIPSFSLVHVISLGSLNLGRPKACGASTITVLSQQGATKIHFGTRLFFLCWA